MLNYASDYVSVPSFLCFEYNRVTSRFKFDIIGHLAMEYFEFLIFNIDTSHISAYHSNDTTFAKLNGSNFLC